MKFLKTILTRLLLLVYKLLLSLLRSLDPKTFSPNTLITVEKLHQCHTCGGVIRENTDHHVIDHNGNIKCKNCHQ